MSELTPPQPSQNSYTVGLKKNGVFVAVIFLTISLTGCQMPDFKSGLKQIFGGFSAKQETIDATQTEAQKEAPQNTAKGSKNSSKNPSEIDIALPPAIPPPPVKFGHAIPSDKALAYYKTTASKAMQSLERLGLKTALKEEELNLLLLDAYEDGFIPEALSAEEITEDQVKEWKLNSPLTRSELAHRLYKANNINSSSFDIAIATFEDVPESHPHFLAVEWINQKKALQGKIKNGAMQFSPNQPVNRGDFCRLAAMGKNQLTTVNQITVEQARQFTPPFRPEGTKRFENLPDFYQFTPQQKTACGWFYQQGYFWTVYHLKPRTLLSKGFEPKKPVTNWEALLLFTQPKT